MKQFFDFRLKFFRIKTFDLYRRYSAVGLLFLLLFGQIISENPTVIARPILVFFEQPSVLHETFYSLLIWFVFVLVWAKTHKEFILGDSLSLFIQSFAWPSWMSRVVDILVLLNAFLIFLIPFGMGIFVSATSKTPFGADGYFWLYFIIIFILTISIAKTLVYGSLWYTHIANFIALFILLFAPEIANKETKLLVLSLPPIALLRLIFSDRVVTWQHTTHKKIKSADFSIHPHVVLLKINATRFFQTHWQDLIPRILWSILPLGFAWWLVHEVGNTRDANLFLHLGIGTFIGLFSGTFRVLLDGRSQFTAYAQSIHYGPLILAMFDYIIVMLLGGTILFSFLLFFYTTAHLFEFQKITFIFIYYFTVLALLGHSWLQKHQRMVEIKFILCALTMALGGHIL